MDDSSKTENTAGIKHLSYKEKSNLFSELVSLGTFSSVDVFDKLVLVSLVSLVYIKMKKTKPNITPLDILVKITETTDTNSYFYSMLESLSLLVEEFSYECKTSNSFNMTDSKEIVNKIKEILSTWTPF